MLQNEATNWLNALFLSTDIWGLFGPFALVIIGYMLAKQEEFLGVMWFILECIICGYYLDLITTTPGYWWNIFIILLGGLFTCIYPLWGRR